MNFSVPINVKDAVQNKSHIIADLNAMTEKEKQKQKNAAIEAILEIRKKQKPISIATIIKARSQVRL